MTIIDCHTHLGRNHHINSTADQLLRSMDKAGIDKSIVFAGNLNDCSNEWMIEQIKNHKDRLMGVAAYDNSFFRYVDFKKLVQDNELVGIKFYTGYDHYYPFDLYEDKGYRTPSSLYHNPLQICSELKIPAIFHCGDCLNSVKSAKLKYAHPLNIDEVAVDYDDVNFIIAHMGYPWHRDAAEVCYKNANVYADISGFVYGDFTESDTIKFHRVTDEFVDICSADKLLFGTDWPISNQKSYVDSVATSPVTLTHNVIKAFNLKGT